MTPLVPRLSRRRFLNSLALSAAIAAGGCRSRTSSVTFDGEIVGANVDRGHQLRHAKTVAADVAHWHQKRVVIVGGGIAGLAALRELVRHGERDCVLLELEEEVGGTARGGSSEVTAYPWGAHYLPAPFASNQPLVQVLDEMGLVEGYDARGEPIFDERSLCREPAERVFIDGAWHDELFLGPIRADANTDNDADWLCFRQMIDQWVAWRDDAGRRAFAIPSSQCSDDPRVRQLDNESMADWLERHELRSPLVRWEVDYACRDDYGTRPAETSAWAGLFYFASRMAGPGDATQPFLTWPEGNARIVRFLRDSLRDQIRTGHLVSSIVPRETGVEIIARHGEGLREATGWRASRVIFAAPQFVAPHVIEGFRKARGADVAEFTYAPWLVANLHLTSRLRNVGFQPAWDNVLRDSSGLGYVIATHQTGRDDGPTVFTYYRALCDEPPREARQRLEQLTWRDAAELTLTDLETAHPDLRPLLERLDVMKWGHAMIRPTPGFRFGAARQRCAAPFHGIHFAHSDLSGIALLEEAFANGLRAAKEVRVATQDM